MSDKLTKIEYLCLEESGIKLHIAKPNNEVQNSNQYLVTIEGLEDHADIVIVGDWEYQCFIECFTKALIAFNQGASRKKFKAFAADVSLYRKQDGAFRLTFSFQQNPISKSHQFIIEATSDQMKSMSCIIDEYLELSPEFQPVLYSSCHDWVCPNFIAHPSEPLIIKQVVQEAKKCIGGTIPSELKAAWFRLLELNHKHEIFAATCKSCKGLFFRVEHWKVQCLGCYKRQTPTAIQPQNLPKAIVSNWLQRVRVCTPSA